ncbi:DNA alkylation repair protein [Candidatus Micrarchaeota archaeon]|nr:DNA alkylation repair protein [Candidatus Micrarchaeota archaeon]
MRKPAAETAQILAELKRQTNLKNVAGMKRFGISGSKMLGISMPVLRQIAKKTGKNHALALMLWESGYHEARILASIVDEPGKVTPRQMNQWMEELDSWDVCDQTCGNLFDKTPFAWKKAAEWAKREKEFQRRAGFALMATLAWHDKQSPDKQFEAFLPLIAKYATDERRFVRKAVNWALRQIGKRNERLRKKAIQNANQILKVHPDSTSAKWIAKDALRELENPATIQRLKS